MSASNWAVCPRCKAREVERDQEVRRDVAAAYGKVPAEEYEALRSSLPPEVDLETLRTFREDYEIYGADTGVLQISYGGSCEKCGLEHHFTDKQPFFDAAAT